MVRNKAMGSKRYLKQKVLLGLCVGYMATSLLPATAAAEQASEHTITGEQNVDQTSGYKVDVGTSGELKYDFAEGTPVNVKTEKIDENVTGIAAVQTSTTSADVVVLNANDKKVTLRAAAFTSPDITQDNGAQINSSAYGINNSGQKNITVGSNTTIVATAQSRKNVNDNIYSVKDSARADAFGIYNTGNSITLGDQVTIEATSLGGYAKTDEQGKKLDCSSNSYGIYNSGEGQVMLGRDSRIKVSISPGVYQSAGYCPNYYDGFSIGVFNAGTGTVAVGDNSTITIDPIFNQGSLSAGAFAQQGAITFEGQLSVVDTYASQGWKTGDKFALLATGDGVINVNQIGQHTVQMRGDVQTGYNGGLSGDFIANGGTINLTLNTPDSYLRGQLITSTSDPAAAGTIKFTLANGAKWQPLDSYILVDYGYGKYYQPSLDFTLNSNVDLNIEKGGVVDMGWYANRAEGNAYRQYRSLTAEKVKLSEGGVFRVNTDIAQGMSDKIMINEAIGGGTQYIQVGYDPAVAADPTAIQGQFNVADGQAIPILTIQQGAENYTVIGQKSFMDTELLRYELEPLIAWQNGVASLTGFKYTNPGLVSENGMIASDAQLALRNLWRLEGDNLLRRLTDLRITGSGQAGAWVKTYRGKTLSDSSYGRSFNEQYTGFQAGYDKARAYKNGRLYTGWMLNHIEDDAFYHLGTGDLESTGLGIYGAWVGETGHYLNLALRGSKFENKYCAKNDVSVRKGYQGEKFDTLYLVNNSSYDNTAYGLSAEYGRRITAADGWFYEPQAGFSAGRIGSSSYTTSRGIEFTQGAVNTAAGKLGILVGKTFDKGDRHGNFYAQASVHRDFGGSGTLHAFYNGKVTPVSVAIDTAEGKDTWCEFRLGANLLPKAGRNSDCYLEVVKTTGGAVRTDWQYNGGFSWRW